MSNRYFEEVDLSPNSSIRKAPVEQFPAAEEFREAIDLFHKEVESMKMGNSDLVVGAIQFPKDICIPSVVLDRFYAKPNQENLRTFIESCQQDLGGRAAKQIAIWFGDVYPKAKEMVK